jgi:hypothetical protein
LAGFAEVTGLNLLAAGILLTDILVAGDGAAFRTVGLGRETGDNPTAREASA